jgi:hypothetical protein
MKLALVFQSIFLENACLGRGSASRGVTNEEPKLRGGDNNIIGFIPIHKTENKKFMFEILAFIFVHCVLPV